MKILKVIFIIIIFLIVSDVSLFAGKFINIDSTTKMLIDNEKKDYVQGSSLYPLNRSDTGKAKIQKRLQSINYYRNQQKKNAEAKKHHKATDDDCVFVKKYSAAERLKHYPFYKVAKIYAVSFECCDRNPEVNVDDTIPHKISDTVFEWGLHISNGKLNYSSLKEIKELNRKRVDELTNIIFNTAYRKPSILPRPGHACYSPRNALIFYDNHGKIFDYLEICFECIRDESLSRKITVGTPCTQKYDLLRKFFVDLGIQFGTARE